MRIQFYLAFYLCLSLAGLQVGATPAPPSASADFEELGEEAVSILAQYLRLNTSNPPGNELESARYLARILKEEGIPYRLFEPMQGRGVLYARLEGDGSAKPLVLLHHMDVVPAEADFWSLDPFSGEVKEGYIWGRGALDSKGLGVVHLMTFLSLKRSQQPLKRDVIFLATADEEAGGAIGAEWFLNNHLNLVEETEFVLTEGGSNLVRDGKLRYVGLETTQKIPLWLRLKVRGRAGHGSVPRADSATHRLVRVLDRLVRFQAPVKIVPEVARYFRAIAPFQPAEFRPVFESLARSEISPRLMRSLNPAHQALLRNTLSLTVLEASRKTNVIPSEAYAELDCRLLPGEDPEDFLRTLQEVISDPAVEIETLLRFESNRSRLDPLLLSAIRKATRELNPTAAVGPFVLPGFTDSHHFRTRNIPAYGFSPFRTPEADTRGIHGIDERISVQDLRFGIQYFHQVVSQLVF